MLKHCRKLLTLLRFKKWLFNILIEAILFEKMSEKIQSSLKR